MRLHYIFLLIWLMAGLHLGTMASPVQPTACDVILLRNGDEISAKVTEVLIQAIKYKKCDFQSGPTYTLAKTQVFMIKYANGSKDVFDQPAPTVSTTEASTPSRSRSLFNQSKGEATSTSVANSTATSSTANPIPAGMARVYFVRKTGFIGCLVRMNAFIDGSKACGIKNRRYAAFDLPAGVHNFDAQFKIQGSQVKNPDQTVTLDLEPGKTYYMYLVLKPGILINDLFCVEMNQKRAQPLIARFKPETKGRVY